MSTRTLRIIGGFVLVFSILSVATASAMTAPMLPPFPPKASVTAAAPMLPPFPPKTAAAPMLPPFPPAVS